MNSMLSTIKEWAGCGIAIMLVIGAATYALVRGTSVGADIHMLRTAADTLNQTAQQAPDAVIDASEIERVVKIREDYESRMRDSKKLGLVVSQLSEEARKSGLTVVEIQPSRPRDINNAPYPLFRVSVVGDYRRIAAYMGECRNQRIPARVVDFTIVPASEDGQRPSESLRAEITVESFAAETDGAKEGADGQA